MFNDMSPHAIAEELGSRVKQVRLNSNITQKELAAATGLSINAIKNAEKGKSQLDTFITIAVSLGLTEQLHLFAPEQTLSPMQLLQLQGKKRQRASSKVDEPYNKPYDAGSW